MHRQWQATVIARPCWATMCRVAMECISDCRRARSDANIVPLSRNAGRPSCQTCHQRSRPVVVAEGLPVTRTGDRSRPGGWLRARHVVVSRRSLHEPTCHGRGPRWSCLHGRAGPTRELLQLPMHLPAECSRATISTAVAIDLRCCERRIPRAGERRQLLGAGDKGTLGVDGRAVSSGVEERSWWMGQRTQQMDF